MEDALNRNGLFTRGFVIICHQDRESYSHALAACESMHASLSSIHNQQENQFHIGKQRTVVWNDYLLTFSQNVYILFHKKAGNSLQIIKYIWFIKVSTHSKTFKSILLKVHSFKSTFKAVYWWFLQNLDLWQNEGAIHNFKIIDYAWISITCCLICAESDKENFVDCRRFICRTVFGSKQWYIHSKSENNFWSISPSVVDIYLVMSAITWAQTTVNGNDDVAIISANSRCC